MTDKPDYMQKARDVAALGLFTTRDNEFAPLEALAVILEALDTEREISVGWASQFRREVESHEKTKAGLREYKEAHDFHNDRADRAEAELQAFKERVSDAMQIVKRVVSADEITTRDGFLRFAEFILPAPEPEPDPLVKALDDILSSPSALTNDQIAHHLRERFPAIAAIGGKQ